MWFFALMKYTLVWPLLAKSWYCEVKELNAYFRPSNTLQPALAFQGTVTEGHLSLCQSHYSDLAWASLRLISPATPPFVQQLFSDIKALLEPRMTQFHYTDVSSSMKQSTHCGLVTPYSVTKLDHYRFRLCTRRLFSAKPLPESLMTYEWLDS